VAVNADEKLLIERLLGRQRAAWEEFVARYQRVLSAQIDRTARQCGRTMRAADLEDACAEVFAVLLANDMAPLRAFRGASSLSTWLTVIARRVCLRHIDRQPRVQSLEMSVPSTVDESGDTSSDVLRDLIRVEESRQLGWSLAQLRGRDRELLGLYFEQQLSYQEISQRMGISINSVGPKIQRARQRLRRIMNQS
jgi:RNA polymerase sigma-70 factor (ECF subfamily)